MSETRMGDPDRTGSVGDVLSCLDGAHRILVTGHKEPDGDCLGSIAALVEGLCQKGKEAYFWRQEQVPPRYTFLPLFNTLAARETHDAEGGFDLLVVLDCSTADRVAAPADLLHRMDVLNIDHHPRNGCFGTINFVRADAAATAEMIYGLLRGLRVDVSRDMARSLFSGLTTDTGSFQYANTTPKAFLIAGELLETGFDISEAIDRIYNSQDPAKLRLTGEVLRTLDTSGVRPGLFWMTLTRSMLRRSGITYAEADGLANYLNRIEGLVIGVLMVEREDDVKVSLRSKRNDVPVNRIARDFGGGGHHRAAGFTIPGRIEDVRQQIIRACEKIL